MTRAKQDVRTGDRKCLSALAAATLTSLAAAQPAASPQPGGPGGAGGPEGDEPKAGAQGIRIEDLPPSVRLGARVSNVRSLLPVISTVVVVPDGGSYIAAIGGWSTKARFPVLIDDGSWAAGEGVARFVRAFKPERVVRFAAAEKPAEGEADRRGAIMRAAAAAWDCDDPAKLPDVWRGMGFAPPGVVIAHPSDPAWTGALALAAGHGQPILWLNARPWNVGVNDWFPYDKLTELQASIKTELSALPWKWEGLGDDIDAVTLCQNAPVKFSIGEISQTTTYAVTDAIGRPGGLAGRAPTEPGRGDRWAWAGQVAGSEWEAAYAAMCSLFLAPERAWLFDGYDETPPWNAWDATAAAGYLQKVGLQTLVDDGSRRGVEDWRRRAGGEPRGGDPVQQARADAPAGLLGMRRGVDASLIFVNSSGNSDFFDLKPGQGKPEDLPFLRVPAVLHMVHSWSATNPANRDTVGGRWLERGVFVYLGSTYEPYLQSFVPTPTVVQRLLYAMPFGAAVRMDKGEPWKLAVLGDPLYVLTRPIVRAAAPLPEALAAARSIAEELPEQLKGRRFAEALKTLRLLGRDEEAARLLSAIIKDQPESLTAEVAVAGLGAAFFELVPENFAAVYAAALPRIVDDPALAACKDMIWQATFTRSMNLSPLEADLLAQSMRPGCILRDASEAARAMKRARGEEAARSVIARARSMTTDGAMRAEIDRAAP